ncbi:MAG: hypothetical protein ACLQF0_09135 [Dissulfurispiraceae bacterium]
MYAIMDKEMKAYSHGPSRERYVIEDYDKLKNRILDPEHWMYGSNLVRMEKIRSGIYFKIRLSWSLWLWKPHLDWRYNHCFHWLFFRLSCLFDYADVPGKIIKDHLADAQKREN